MGRCELFSVPWAEAYTLNRRGAQIRCKIRDSVEIIKPKSFHQKIAVVTNKIKKHGTVASEK